MRMFKAACAAAAIVCVMLLFIQSRELCFFPNCSGSKGYSVLVYAGADIDAGFRDFPLDGGFADGPASIARFDRPVALAVDSQGNVYVADQGNNRIRKISTSGDVTTLAGSGLSGRRDGPGTSADFDSPSGIAVDSLGNVYVADKGSSRIRKITPNGYVSTIAGDSKRHIEKDTIYDGHNDHVYGFNKTVFGRNNKKIQFGDGTVTGVSVDNQGYVFASDRRNNVIWMVAPDGELSILAGSGYMGRKAGIGSASEFYMPTDVAVDLNGNVYVTDLDGVSLVAATGDVSILAGIAFSMSRPTPGYKDGPGHFAEFNAPSGLALDHNGNVYVAEGNNFAIRKITSSGHVSTFPARGSCSWPSGIGTKDSPYFPSDVAVGNNGVLYFSDDVHNVIFKVTSYQ